MRSLRVCRLLSLGLFLGLCCRSAFSGDAPAGGAYAEWVKHQESVRKDGSLLRYYDFHQLRDLPGPIPNLVGSEAPLVLKSAAKPGESDLVTRAIPGRWPDQGKRAVRLDQAFLAAPAFEPVKKAFTVEAWLRKIGPGTLGGNAGATNGTLLSIGSGYWDGWRLTTNYADPSRPADGTRSRTIGFEIGRPKPGNSIGVQTGPVADGVWFHLAATWDGREMRVYVNGLVAAAKDYAGEYTPSAKGVELRIGFADHGFGSVVFDVDEVAVYARALPAEEILAKSHFYAAPPAGFAAKFETLGKHLEQNDDQAAGAVFREIVSATDLHPDLRALTQLRVGHSLAARGKAASAAAQFVKVFESDGVSERHRREALMLLVPLLRDAPSDALSEGVFQAILAMDGVGERDKLEARLSLARNRRDAKEFSAARVEYRKVLASAEAAPRDRLNVRLELGHAALEAKDFAAARVEYEGIVSSDAPASFKSIAQLRIAESHVREKNYAAAKAALAILQSMADAPPHHRSEAEERTKEIARLEAGQPARDPNVGRVKVPQRPKPGLKLYVAPTGSDTNPGSQEKPFATPQRARDEIRTVKQRGGLPTGGIEVNFREGIYPLKETWRLAAEDSGSEESPITYRAFPGETARLNGGTKLAGLLPVADPAVLARLDPAVRGKVFQVDLRKQGISDFGDVAGINKRPDLYFNGRPLTLARWPNEGFVNVGDVLGETELKVWNIKGSKEGKFTYDGDRPNRWKDEKEVWLYGYWFWDWADAYQRVASIDTEKRILSLAPPYHNYGYRKGQRYHALNLLSEIDVPGEWYLDRASGIAYLCPLSDPAAAAVEMSLLSGPMIEIAGASHITLEHLGVDTGRGDGVVVRGGQRCLVAGCTLRQLGENGVSIEDGSGHGIFGCEIHTLGRGGTRIRGGDRKTLTPNGHFIENCHVHDFSRIGRTYTPAVWTDGVGTRIAHNRFHDSPCHAMRIEGNDHLVEFNEVYRVVMESDDQGGVDMFYNPGYRGNVFRYNFWRDMGGGQTHGVAGIRLDDAICGTLIYGNVFYRCSASQFGGVQIHGGKENVVDNNLFVDCKYAVSFSPWGEQRWKETLARPEVVKMLHETVDITKPPYSTRYPDLARLAEKPDVNMAWRNLVASCGQFLTRDRGIQDLADNYITRQNSVLTDPTGKGESFRLNAISEVYDRLGWRPIPFEEIGQYEHPLRARRD